MTTKLPSETWLHYWYEALREELGLFIEVAPDDKMKLVNSLYAARQEASDPKLDGLMIMQPMENVVYIIHKPVEIPE
jgi:DUF1365 family protein